MEGPAEMFVHMHTTNRNCTMEINNLSSHFCLRRPKVHMESGFPFSPPQPTVRTNKPEVCSFTKDDNTATGAVGILTYELFDMKTGHCDEVIAIMFSVPFDYKFYKNWMALGIFECTRKCDKELFDLMYEEEEDFTNFQRRKGDGCGLLYRGRMVDLRGCMSSEGRATLKLELYDKM